jgi:hypothetical protein
MRKYNSPRTPPPPSRRQQCQPPMRAATALVELTMKGRVATITLNDPARLNALSVDMGEQFKTVVQALKQNCQGIGAVVLTGAGKSFSAGGDLCVHCYFRALSCFGFASVDLVRVCVWMTAACCLFGLKSGPDVMHVHEVEVFGGVHLYPKGSVYARCVSCLALAMALVDGSVAPHACVCGCLRVCTPAPSFEPARRTLRPGMRRSCARSTHASSACVSYPYRPLRP